MEDILGVFERVFGEELLCSQADGRHGDSHGVEAAVVEHLDRQCRSVPFVEVGHVGVVDIQIVLVRRNVVPLEIGFRGVPRVRVADGVVLGVVDDDQRLAGFDQHILSVAGNAVERIARTTLLAEVLAFDHLAVHARIESARKDQHHAVGIEVFVGVVTDLDVLVAQPPVRLSRFGKRRACEVDLLDHEFAGLQRDVALFDGYGRQNGALAAPRHVHDGRTFRPRFVLIDGQHQRFARRFGFIDLNPRRSIGGNIHVEIFLGHVYQHIAAERAQDFGYDDGINRFFGIVGAGCEARCEEGRGEN